jgi:amino acid transporter
MMPGECIILGKLVHGLFPALAPSIVGASLALLFTAINLAGIRFSGIVQFLLTAALFVGVFIFIFAGIPELELQNFTPFFGRGAGGIFLMIPIAMLAFMGYDVLPQAAEEVNAPIRKMVFIIPVSIFFVAFMYIAVLLVTSGVVPWETIAKNTENIPIMPSVLKALGSKGAYIIIIAGICGLITTMNAFMVGGSRLLYAMAQDREIPAVFGKLSRKASVPYAGILFIGALGVAGSFIQELIVLFDTAAASVLVSYFLVALTVLVLRRKEPELERPYRIHGYPYIPIIAAIAVVPTWVIAVAILKVWALGVFIGWVLLGCGYYLFVRKKR